MTLTPEQRNLKSAVENDNFHLAKFYLEQGADPNFFFGRSETVLMEAIRNHNIKMVRLLVQKGADVNLSRPGTQTPLDLAEDVGDIVNDYGVVNYLKKKRAQSQYDINYLDSAKPSSIRATKKVAADENVKDPPKPLYTKDNLKDIFNPESWVGKLDDMKKSWEKVPAKLKKDFDFAAALAEARRQTLKAGRPKTPPKPPL